MSNKRQQQIALALVQFYRQPIAKVSLELFLTIGLVVFLGAFAIQPTLATMSKLVQEIEEKKEVDVKLGQKIASLSSAQTEYASLARQRDMLDEALPTYPDVVIDLKKIEKIASLNSILITNLSLSEFPPEFNQNNPKMNLSSAKRQSLPVVLSIQGDYISIRSFVESLRSSRRSIEVKSVVFSLKKNRGKESLTASITLDIPYFGVEK
ncbi:MAG: type 4a pilus biogenesis protein PilO [Patescibacteria group bacterium]|nr:type 4a pilus biogenesis protein PilO [Patescibacteria group bacterium]